MTADALKNHISRVLLQLSSIEEVLELALATEDLSESVEYQRMALQILRRARAKMESESEVVFGDSIVVSCKNNSPIAEVKGSSKEKILVAEDNTVDSQIIQSALSKNGYDVTCVPDGRSAVRKLSLESFSVVLMDLMMPRMDGIDAVNFIRSQETRNGGRIPIVAISSVAAKEYSNNGSNFLELLDGYLKKPIDIQALLKKVKDAVEIGKEREGEPL